MLIKSHKVIITAFFGCLFVFSIHFTLGADTIAPEVNKEIQDLDNTIKQRKAQLEDIKKQQEKYRLEIENKQNQRATLENQLGIVQTKAAETELGLAQAKVDIETTNLEIQKVTLEISDQDKKITDNKDHLGSALKLLSQEDGKSQLEIILLNNYLTDYVNQVRYLEDINSKISDNLSTLRLTKDRLEENQAKLATNSEKLRQLKKELEEQQVALASEKDTKGFLINQTKNSESEYQSLLAQAKQEQNAASADVLNLEKTLRDKINQAGDNKVKLSYSGFIWPVPSRVITAYFHDPSYPFKYIFDHPAVDIRSPQGTPIRAAASGYVGRAKDGGLGYSYIMLLHGGNLATVYGHVSKIYVKEDEYVTQGQIIGLSGAMPGTPGAGSLTTGPHLHLEVRLNGIPVDPVAYLP
ncbi:MAG TPA: peptidoglycan DD-metalloendopeptidase family protein [bacterium]|nr:peptidoglycan DD-metalloendopeptidase family protein [bacterium]